MSTLIQQKEGKLIEKMAIAGMKRDIIMQELSFAKQLYNDSPAIQKCEAESVLSAVVNVANIGLTLNPAASECYIVPRYDRASKTMKAYLEPSYRGLIKLIIQEGSVSSIIAEAVYQKDKIEYEPTNSREPIRHKGFVFGERGHVVGFYAIATLKDGSKQAEAMSTQEVNDIRENSESWKNEKSRPYSPWARHYNEMGRKTVIRRIYKYLPRGDNKRLYNAIQLDNEGYGATFSQIQYIESLLRSASITPQRSDEIHRNLDHLSFDDAQKMIEELKDNQVTDIRYTGTGMQKKGEGSIRSNIEKANDDERR